MKGIARFCLSPQRGGGAQIFLIPWGAGRGVHPDYEKKKKASSTPEFAIF